MLRKELIRMDTAPANMFFFTERNPQKLLSVATTPGNLLSSSVQEQQESKNLKETLSLPSSFKNFSEKNKISLMGKKLIC